MKKLSIILALAMVLALLAGCGSVKSDDAAPVSETAAAPAAAVEPAPAAEPAGTVELVSPAMTEAAPVSEAAAGITADAPQTESAAEELSYTVETPAAEPSSSYSEVDGGIDWEHLIDIEEIEADPDTDDFALYLMNIQSCYFPGTEGCELTAAANAGRIADYFVSSSLNPGDVHKSVQNYYNKLSPADAEYFLTQLEGVVAAFDTISGSGGKSVLKSAGYEPNHYPWSEKTVQYCFLAMLGADQ